MGQAEFAISDPVEMRTGANRQDKPRALKLRTRSPNLGSQRLQQT